MSIVAAIWKREKNVSHRDLEVICLYHEQPAKGGFHCISHPGLAGSTTGWAHCHSHKRAGWILKSTTRMTVNPAKGIRTGLLNKKLLFRILSYKTLFPVLVYLDKRGKVGSHGMLK